jgi:hypothetical protein
MENIGTNKMHLRDVPRKHERAQSKRNEPRQKARANRLDSATICLEEKQIFRIGISWRSLEQTNYYNHNRSSYRIIRASLSYVKQ